MKVVRVFVGVGEVVRVIVAHCLSWENRNWWL